MIGEHRVTDEHPDPVVERLVASIDGPLHTRIDGSKTRDREKGMAHKLDVLYNERRQRSGIPPRQFWVGVGTTIGTVIGYLEIIGHV